MEVQAPQMITLSKQITWLIVKTSFRIEVVQILLYLTYFAIQTLDNTVGFR